MYSALSVLVSYLDLPACSGLGLQISFTPQNSFCQFILFGIIIFFFFFVLNATDFGQLKYTLQINIF